MSRPIRRLGHSQVYHIILKGIDNQDIFYDSLDRKFFLKQISITKKNFNYLVYAYCLMTNHVHMVIKCKNDLLSKSIQSLVIRYVHYFNKKYSRKGSLVQDRFKSKNVETPKYFLEVCRYVHRNPEKAGIALTQNYEWSSYREYLGQEKIIDKQHLLYYFNNNLNKFVDYTTKTIGIDSIEDFVEYELINKLTDEQLTTIIMKKFDISDINQIGVFFKYRDRNDLKEDLEKIKTIPGTNKTQVARVIRIGRKVIQNLWNS